jgi:cation:H+ antiporter
MPTAIAIPVFVASLAVTLQAASVFARRLDRIGLRLGLPETILGILTALAADAPEISSAVAALVQGAHGVAIGVVVGSNAFNLAAMIGLSAILTGRVHLRREALALEGFVGLWVTVVVTVVVAGGIGPATGLVLLGVVVFPYVALLALGPRGVARFRLPHPIALFMRRTFGEGHRAAKPHPSHGDAVLTLVLVLMTALTIIVVGAIGMVSTAITLGDRWSVPRPLVGVLVLAVLTSIPNAFTAVRLGLQGRGSALTSETMNSNSINLAAGVAVPALFVGVGALTGLVAFDLAGLIVMTVIALALLGRKNGMTRPGGYVLVALYAAFVSVQIAARL